MEKNFCLHRILEATILSVPCFFIGCCIFQLNLKEKIGFFEKLSQISIGILMGAIVAAVVLNIVKFVLFDKFTQHLSGIYKKLIENIIVDLYLLLISSLLFIFTRIVYLVVSMEGLFEFIIKLIIEGSLYTPLYLVLFTIHLLVIDVLLLITTLIFFIAYFFIVPNQETSNYIPATRVIEIGDLCLKITNFFWQLSKIFLLLTLINFTLGAVGSCLVLIYLVLPIIFKDFYLLGVFIIYLLMSVLVVLLVGMGILLSIILGYVTNIISNSGFKSVTHEANKIIFDSILFFNQALLWVVKFLLPYSAFGIFSDIIYVGIIQITLVYLEKSEITPQSYEIRKLISQFAEDFLKSNLYLINFCSKVIRESYIQNKAWFVKTTASKLLLFGDLRQTDLLYSKLWEFLKYNREYCSDKQFFNRMLAELCNYYIETSQAESLNVIISEMNTLINEDKTSLISYIVILMRATFASSNYSPAVEADISAILLDWQNKSNVSTETILELIGDILVGSPENIEKAITTFYGKYNSYFNSIDSARFFEKFEDYIRSVKPIDETNYEDFSDRIYQEFLVRDFLETNCQDILHLLSSLHYLFEIQNKIYTFLSTKDAQWLPNDGELKIALGKSFSFDILGFKAVWHNPFYRDNLKLIPLVYLLIDDSSSGLQVLDSQVRLAIAQGRQVDLAFLKCYQGKIQIKNGSVPKGLKTLLGGIKLYEGIRYSVSTDQLGVGFGSSYLEYYDWIIDALVQMGYPRLAFDGVERSTARALLDLVSRRTYRFHSLEKSNTVAKLIGEIQDIDFNIYFLQSQPYKAPFFSQFLPDLLQTQLKIKFDKDKAERLNRLRKKKDSLIVNLDPESCALVEFEPLTWGTFSEDGENFIPFEALWSSEAVSQKEVILSFHVIHKINFVSKDKEWEKIFCFALYQGSYHHHLIDDPQTVAELQQECQTIFTEKIKDRKNPSRLNRSLSYISNHLLIPLLTNLPSNCNSLIISANSDLQFFPWSALYYQDEPDANKRLIDKFTIKTTPSLSLLYLLKLRENSRPVTPTKFLVAGIQNYPPPQTSLFWSGVEIERISQFYPSNSVRRLKDVEVDQHFANEFKKAEVIHYSGHGYYDSKLDSEKEALEKTYLCLYNQNISAAQILDGALENPTAKVMILSACLTGTGDLTTSGSEILGLERALFHAGLSSLITTLWSVGEFSTALLMLKLHSVWRSHNNTVNTLASSLREAQLWLKNLTWKQLKQEFPQIEQDVKKGMEVYTNLIRDAEANQNNKTADKLKAEYSYYEYVSDELKSESTDTPFRHPYYWAAFQVKGMG